jgi:hypothetical protein
MQYTCWKFNIFVSIIFFIILAFSGIFLSIYTNSLNFEEGFSRGFSAGWCAEIWESDNGYPKNCSNFWSSQEKRIKLYKNVYRKQID